MDFHMGEEVKIFDEAENEWFDGMIVEPYDDSALVEYETPYYWHVRTVKFEYIRKEERL